MDPDLLPDPLTIEGQQFYRLADLRAFISKNHSGKLADFERKYSKHSSSQHPNLFLDKPSSLRDLYNLDFFNKRMLDFKTRNECTAPGAWLMMTLQNDDTPDPETVVVITFGFI
jgi:hypothetical protein